MLEVLVEASARSLVLAAAVWLVLRLSRLRDRHIQFTAWTIVLSASLLMPFATRVAAIVFPASLVVLPAIDLPPSRSDLFPIQPADLAARRAVGPYEEAPAEVGGKATIMPDARSGAAASNRGLGWRSFAALVHGVVCGALLIRLLTGLWLSGRIVRAATPIHENWTAGHDVRVSRAVGAPATFGSIILLPHDYTAWPPVKRLAVLAHEGAHVRRRDFHVQIAANLNRAIFWFNPLSWWLRRQLSDLAETVSDDAAILDLHDRLAYAEILLEIACCSPRLSGGVAMGRPATVHARIERILTETEVPGSVSKRYRIIHLGSILPLLVLAASPLTVNPSLSAPDDTAIADQQAPHQRIQIDPKLLDADVGFYEDMKSGSVMIVTRDGDHLLTGRVGKARLEQYPFTDHDFFLTNWAQENTFVADPSGKVSRVIHRYNGLTTTLDRITQETAQWLRAEYDRRIAEQLAPHARVKLNPEVLRDYVGYYQLTPTNILTLTREGDQLFVNAIEQRPVPIFPYGERDFFYTSAAAQITFLKSKDDVAPALVLHQDGLDRTAPRVSADVIEGLRRRLDDERRPHAPLSIDATSLEGYVGRYGNSDVTMNISRGGDHLVAQAMGYSKYGVYPYTDRDFFATTFSAQISFVKDASGKVERLVRHQNGEDLVLYRFDQTSCPPEGRLADCSQ